MAARRRRIVLSCLLQELADDSTEIMLGRCMEATAAILIDSAVVQDDKRSDPRVHVQNYVEETVPRYTDWQFRAHFRMNRTTFEELTDGVCPHLPRERSLSVDKKLLATVWIVGNKESYRSVADRFGISKGSLHRTVMTVCHVLTDLRSDVIKWPKRVQMYGYANDFKTRTGFPGVVGAIDGTYIKIPGPLSEHRDAYICRKGFPAMHLQVVCNNSLLFLHVSTGNPGSVHDSRVFRNSELRTLLEDEQTALPPDCHLLGDSAYALKDYLIVPYRDNGHLSDMDKAFNKVHSSTRVVVERAIRLLKGKFQRLKYLDMINLVEIPFVIFEACVLHNFIILSNGIDEEDIDTPEQELEDWAIIDDGEHNTQSGCAKRLAIAQSLV